jgi:hypothetical protein
MRLGCGVGLVAMLLAMPRPAWSQELQRIQVPPFFFDQAGPSSGDSVAECRALHVPLPTHDGMVYAGMGDAMAEMAVAFVLGPLSVLTPQPGLRLGRGSADFSLSWSMSLPVGPATACQRERGNIWYFHSHRVVLDSTFVPARPRELALRPGYRYVWHRSDAWIGIGGGLAPVLQVEGPGAFRAGVSPELLVHVGRCCRSVYPFASVRWDRYFSGAARNQWNASLGLGYW